MKIAATIIALIVYSAVIGGIAHAQLGPGNRLGLEPGSDSVNTTRRTIGPEKEKAKKSHKSQKAHARHHQ